MYEAEGWLPQQRRAQEATSLCAAMNGGVTKKGGGVFVPSDFYEDVWGDARVFEEKNTSEADVGAVDLGRIADFLSG